MTPDKVVTIVLLALGVLATFGAYMTAMAMPQAMQEMYRQYGLGTYVAPEGMWLLQLGMVLSFVIPLLIAILWSVQRIKAKKFAFWVPITFAAIAFLLFFMVMIALILNDPNLMDYIYYRSY